MVIIMYEPRIISFGSLKIFNQVYTSLYTTLFYTPEKIFLVNTATL